MYIVLNHDTLSFIHKHADMEVSCNLAFIEATGNSYSVCDVTTERYDDFTLTEMQTIYRNSTNLEPDTNDWVLMIKYLRQIAELFPVTDVNKWEVEAQANYVEKNQINDYLYVKGATIPSIKPSLFKSKTLKKSESKKLVLERIPDTNTPPIKTAPIKTGTVKCTIWDLAEQLWLKEGKPVDKCNLTSIRKRITVILIEDHNIHKTTTNVQLLAWQKTKLVS